MLNNFKIFFQLWVYTSNLDTLFIYENRSNGNVEVENAKILQKTCSENMCQAGGKHSTGESNVQNEHTTQVERVWLWVRDQLQI